MGFEFDQLKRKTMAPGSAGATTRAPTEALQRATGNRATGMLLREAATDTPAAVPEAKPTPAAKGKMGIRLNLEGVKQGKMSGSEGDGKIEVYSYERSAVRPTDSASGAAQGRAQHKAIVITKPFDGASPMIEQAFENNEELKTVDFDFLQTDKEGTQSTYQTIKLTGARVVSYDQTVKDGAAVESVSIGYDRSEMVNTGANRSSTANTSSAGT